MHGQVYGHIYGQEWLLYTAILFNQKIKALIKKVFEKIARDIQTKAISGKYVYIKG